MRRYFLLIVVLVTLGIPYSRAALAHISGADGHLGSYLFGEGSNDLDPLNLIFTHGKIDPVYDHFNGLDSYATHFVQWDAFTVGGELWYGSHGTWRSQHAQSATATCFDCVRDHIRWYKVEDLSGGYDGDNGYYTPGFIHRDIVPCGSHVGAWFDLKKEGVRNEYANNGGHPYLERPWNNTKPEIDCKDHPHGGNGMVIYIDNRH
jgi:hypothetical protein